MTGGKTKWTEGARKSRFNLACQDCRLPEIQWGWGAELIVVTSRNDHPAKSSQGSVVVPSLAKQNQGNAGQKETRTVPKSRCKKQNNKREWMMEGLEMGWEAKNGKVPKEKCAPFSKAANEYILVSESGRQRGRPFPGNLGQVHIAGLGAEAKAPFLWLKKGKIFVGRQSKQLAPFEGRSTWEGQFDIEGGEKCCWKHREATRCFPPSLLILFFSNVFASKDLFGASLRLAKQGLRFAQFCLQLRAPVIFRIHSLLYRFSLTATTQNGGGGKMWIGRC